MTIPVELINDPISADGEPNLDSLDWSPATEDEASHQEINDRRARQENAETLRLVRSL